MIEFTFTDFDWLLATALFAGYLLVDGLYALYTVFVIDRRPAAAASVGFVMHFILAFGVVSYVQNYAYVFPLALGSFVGTYLVVRFERDHQKTLKPKV